jgi:hypothetical protein
MIFLVVAAALLVGAPLLAAVLVTVASHREDAAQSLALRPPGPLSAVARRLLDARVGGSGPMPRRSAAADPRTARQQDDDAAMVAEPVSAVSIRRQAAG